MVGIIIGALYEYLGNFGDAAETFSSIDPSLILLLFLPALIFDSAFNCDWFIFKKQFINILILAGPMLVVCSCLTAVVMKYIIMDDDRFDWTASLLFGFLISATDPVATIAILKELGTSKKLSILIEGESLLNDGTAMVGFLVLLVSFSLIMSIEIYSGPCLTHSWRRHHSIY